MADIGTDHGFLPIYLRENDICPKVIMTDISEPSLQKAKGFAGAYQFGGEMDFRAGDGLKVLEEGEVDTVVIAGMGGILMTQILGDDIDKSRSFQKYIFQPRNHCGELRYWLTKNCFTITDNLLVREGKFICEIIVAEPLDPHECDDFNVLADDMIRNLPTEDHMIWKLPADLGSNDAELLHEYLQRMLHTEEKILEGMHKGQGVSKEDIDKTCEGIALIKEFKEV